VYKVLVGKPEEKRHKHEWEEDINNRFKIMKYGGVE
jgi:hypothetical protein